MDPTSPLRYHTFEYGSVQNMIKKLIVCPNKGKAPPTLIYFFVDNFFKIASLPSVLINSDHFKLKSTVSTIMLEKKVATKHCGHIVSCFYWQH